MALMRGALYLLYGWREYALLRDRRAKGLCLSCGYDLTGNVIGLRRKGVAVEKDEAVRLAAEHVEPSWRKGMCFDAAVEYPDCWSISFDWPEPDGAVRSLPTGIRLEVDKVSKTVTHFPRR